MKRNIFRKLSLCARDLLLLHRLSHNPNPNHVPTSPLFSLSASTRSTSRFFSSGKDFPGEPRFTQAQNKDATSDAAHVITEEELKKRIAKLEEGDREAIPEVFEGILERLLSEKPDDLRKEILGKEEEMTDDDMEDEGFDSEEEDMSECETDEEEIDSNYNKTNRR